MKVAIYVRVSKFDQNPENQKRELVDYIKRKPDWELYDIYEDIVSGAKESRPRLNDLMIDARNGLFKHVIFWKVDRLGRNAIHTQTIAEEFKRLGITFTITSLDIDTSTASGKFIFGIFAQFAEMERAMTIERVNLMYARLRKEMKDNNGFYINSKGQKRTSFGRPKGAKDKKQRKKGGYYLRYMNKKVTPARLPNFYSNEIQNK